MQNLSNYIAEIAKRTGIHISKDDPILCLYAFLELFLEELVSTMKSLEAEQGVNNEKLVKSWRDSAQELSEKALSAALSASKTHAKGLFDEASKRFQKDLKEQLEQISQIFIEKKQREKSKIQVLFWTSIILFILSSCMLVISIASFLG